MTFLNKSMNQRIINFMAPFLAAVFISISGFAAPATFGAEFNFSNFKIANGEGSHFVDSDASEAARDAMMQKVLQICLGCHAVVIENSYGVKNYKIVYPDGWYFMIATDPGVVEIQTKPSTTEQISDHLQRIQSDIFEAALAVQLLPATEVYSSDWAGSHIHVGTQSALGEGRKAVQQLRNFMVDFSNHPEIAMGVFTADDMNAPPLAKLPRAQRKLFGQIIADVDSGKIRSVNTFAKRVRTEVYDVSVYPNLSPTTKYQAFNVNRIGNANFDLSEQTFEIRAMRGQESALDFLIQTRLIQARLSFLSKSEAPIVLDIPSVMMSEEQKAEAFYRYVVETGLDFKPYRKFLSQNQRSYLRGIWERGSSNLMCEAFFF